MYEKAKIDPAGIPSMLAPYGGILYSVRKIRRFSCTGEQAGAEGMCRKMYWIR